MCMSTFYFTKHPLLEGSSPSGYPNTHPYSEEFLLRPLADTVNVNIWHAICEVLNARVHEEVVHSLAQ